MRAFWRSFLLVGAVASTAGAQGNVIYNHTGFGITNSWDISNETEAMNFVLQSPATVTAVGIDTYYWGDPSTCTDTLPICGNRGAFDWALYANGQGDVPGTMIASGTTPAVANGGVGAFTSWTIPVTPTTLSSNTRYWISLTNTDSTHSLQYTGLAWTGNASIDGTVASAYQLTPGGPWTAAPIGDTPDFGDGNRLAMTLYGTPTTVPEPSSAALLGMGLMALGPLVSRRTLKSA